MIITNEYGEKELYCDDCMQEITDDSEIYEVEGKIICIFCLRSRFRKED